MAEHSTNLLKVQRIENCIAIAEICARALRLAVGPGEATQADCSEQQSRFAAELADGEGAKFCHVLSVSDRITVTMHVHEDLAKIPKFEIGTEGEIVHNNLTEKRLKILKAFLKMALRTNSLRWRL